MDIRDIKEKVPVVEDKLDKIYDLQLDLISSYVVIEGMKEPPLNINLKEDQAMIKDFIGRVIEEVAEGLESLDRAIQVDKDIRGESVSKREEKYNSFILPMMYNFNEEMADALHFMVELLIFSNISSDDILSYIDTNIEKVKFSDVDIENGGTKYVEKLDIIYEVCRKRTNQQSNKLSGEPKRFFPILYTDDIDYMNLGGNYISEANFSDMLILYAQTTYMLNIGRNTLKNKPWKQSEMKTDVANYRAYMIEGFLKLFEFFVYSGITEENIYRLYFLKNKVNQFRIKSKY